MKVAGIVKLWLVLLVLAVGGCATTSTSLKSQDMAKIKRIGLASSFVDEKPRVLDHTGVMQKTYGGYMYGAVGGLMEGLILAAERHVKVKSSLGGSIDELQAEVRSCPELKELLDRKLEERLAKTYSVTNLQTISQKAAGKGQGSHDRTSELLKLCKSHQLDTLLSLDLAYGMAAYAGENASTAIDGVVAVYDVGSGSCLMKRKISSDEYFRRPRTVKELKANNAQLFRDEIAEAADGLSILVGAQLGVGGDVAVKKPYETVQVSMFSSESSFQIDPESRKEVEINGYHVYVAGSGKRVMVRGPCHTHEEVKNVSGDGSVTESAEVNGLLANKCLNAVVDVLSENNVKVLKTTTLVYVDDVVGYLLEFDADGYSILMKYAKG